MGGNLGICYRLPHGLCMVIMAICSDLMDRGLTGCGANIIRLLPVTVSEKGSRVRTLNSVIMEMVAIIHW